MKKKKPQRIKKWALFNITAYNNSNKKCFKSGNQEEKWTLLATEQTNWNVICIGCKLMLGSGIVAFITGAAGQLVWEDLQ